MIMLLWITKIKLELMAYEAMFATTRSWKWFPSAGDGVIRSQK
jgi:hypothetical protein